MTEKKLTQLDVEKLNMAKKLFYWIDTTPGQTQVSVGEECGIKKSGMQTWKNEGVPTRHVEKVAKIMGASVESLTRADILPTGIVTPWLEDEDLPNFFVKIPRLDIQISAGNACPVWYPDEKKPLIFQSTWLQNKQLSPERLIVMTVYADSMSPEVKDGDIVLIDTTQNQHIIDGGIYAILIGDDIKLKYLHKRVDGSIRISSENSSKYPDEIITSEADCFQIIGRKVWRGG